MYIFLRENLEVQIQQSATLFHLTRFPTFWGDESCSSVSSELTYFIILSSQKARKLINYFPNSKHFALPENEQTAVQDQYGNFMEKILTEILQTVLRWQSIFCTFIYLSTTLWAHNKDNGNNIPSVWNVVNLYFFICSIL